jgi:GTP-binding protein
MDGSDPLENYRAIRAELEQYDVDLAARPEIVAVSKAELPGASEVRDQLAAEIGRPVLLFSAVTGQGLNDVIRGAYQLLNEERQST